MMNHKRFTLSNLLCVSFLLLAALPASSQSWTPVGSAGFTSFGTDQTILDIDTNSNLYVACVGYITPTTYDPAISVMKYSGSSWTSLGPLAGWPNSGSADLAVGINGTPYLTAGNFMQTAGYSFDGTAWSMLGSALTTDMTMGTSIVCSSDGNPYVSYSDAYFLGAKATVMKWGGTLGWLPVGLPQFTPGPALNGQLAISKSDTLFMGYVDVMEGDKVSVMKYDGNAWTPVGGAGLSDTAISGFDIAVAPDGQPVVCYGDWGHSRKLTVRKFDGVNWVTLGTEGFTANPVSGLSIAINSNGEIFISYNDENDGKRVSVVRYNSSTWSLVGLAAFSGGGAGPTSMKVSEKGKLYVAYKDNLNGGKATVMQYCLQPSVPSLSASSDTVCSGDAVTLFITDSTQTFGSTGWMWYEGSCGGVSAGTGSSNIVNPVTSGYYFSRGEGGCTEGNCDSVFIFVHALPVAPVISRSGDILSSSVTSGNQWLLNGINISGATNQTHIALENGNYTVKVTNEQGCSAHSAPFDVSDIVGIHHSSKNNPFSIFPNPCTSLLTIKGIPEDLGDNATLKLADLTGRTIIAQTLNKENNKINLSKVAPGLYFLNITHRHGKTAFPVVKK